MGNSASSSVAARDLGAGPERAGPERGSAASCQQESGAGVVGHGDDLGAILVHNPLLRAPAHDCGMCHGPSEDLTVFLDERCRAVVRSSITGRMCVRARPGADAPAAQPRAAEPAACSVQPPAGQVVFTSASALDCAPALQAAVDRLPLSGGRVYVAPGSYQLRSSLVLRDKHGVHLCGACRGQQGAHQGGTVLRCGAPGSAAPFQQASFPWLAPW
jgi:hypothetical protein